MNTVHFVNDVHISPSPRAARRLRRLDGILDTAAAVVARDGLGALSLHRLAEELGVVPAALYRYFSSKDALTAELQRRTITLLHAELGAALAGVRERAAAARLDERALALAEIVAASDLYLGLPLRAPEHFGLISVLLADPRPLVPAEEAKQTAPLLLAFLNDVRDVLARAASVGALTPGDAFDRTLVLWSALQGAAQLGKISRFEPKRFDATRLGREALRALLMGWGAKSSELDRALATPDRPAKTKSKKRSS